jgi:nitrite reductase (NO-forming)
MNQTTKPIWFLLLLLLASLALLPACRANTRALEEARASVDERAAERAAQLAAQATEEAAQPTAEPESGDTTEMTHTGDTTGTGNVVSYTLHTGTNAAGEGGLTFVGVGGEIDEVVNPILTANPGDTVEITVINGDGLLHDLTIDEFGVTTGELATVGAEMTVSFTVDQEGEFIYYCSVPGHRLAGMFGTLKVGEGTVEVATGENIIHNPADVPEPVGDREPQTTRVDLTTQEVVGQLADGTTYSYFTFNGTVPGPMLRVRVGDTVELHLANDAGSQFSHSIDLHAVTGPGGGHLFTETAPGEESVFTFQALAPGLYVYHCATPSVPYHITNGMYGLILVEPEGGLPPVDREYYVMQGELYTEQPFGEIGATTFSAEKMSHEQPEYYIFNGAAGALTLEDNVLRANVGETVRIFFGVGGPNKTSSFHVIGEIFDRAYSFASLTSEPITDVQTVTVPPGGAWVVELTADVPGTYILVDHALSRTERGLAGYLVVEGEEQPHIFHEGPADS